MSTITREKYIRSSYPKLLTVDVLERQDHVVLSSIFQIFLYTLYYFYSMKKS